MIRYEFGIEDLARTRFAISPMGETAAAVRGPSRSDLVSLHRLWFKRVRGAIRDLNLSLAPLRQVQGEIAGEITIRPDCARGVRAT